MRKEIKFESRMKTEANKIEREWRANGERVESEWRESEERERERERGRATRRGRNDFGSRSSQRFKNIQSNALRLDFDERSMLVMSSRANPIRKRDVTMSSDSDWMRECLCDEDGVKGGRRV
jgi:hypothetical protein